MAFSSLLAERTSDVYLSFSSQIPHGIDLCCYFSQNGIKTFTSDSWKEKRCRPLDQRILEALAESKFAVVMTSEKKAYSVGFLEELVTIIQFHEEKSLIVIPIFFTDHHLGVEEICQHNLGEHEEMHPSRAPFWRQALTKLNNIATKYSFSTDHLGIGRVDRLKKIVDDIWLMLLSTTSVHFNGLVGMDRPMNAFLELLALGSIKEVRTIGIWGNAGVGKTTLARYIYENVSTNFHKHVFLKNADNMKDKFLSERKFEGGELQSFDYEEHEITEAMCKHRKFLLIVDDVNKIEQGKWIAETTNWFGPGSRVVVVSQDKSLLVKSGVKYLYEVESLRYDEALELFSQFAFKQPYPPTDFERLAIRAVHFSGFLPFTLKLFGLFLTGKSQEQWDAALLKLNAKHGEDIMEVWKIMEASEDKNVEEASKQKTK